MALTKYQKMDYEKYYLEKGDATFNEKRNRAVIENSIKKSEILERAKKKAFLDQYSERADAIVTYLKAIDRGRVNTDLGKFFGLSNLKHLQGADYRLQLREEIQRGIQMVKQKSKLKRFA